MAVCLYGGLYVRVPWCLVVSRGLPWEGLYGFPWFASVSRGFPWVVSCGFPWFSVRVGALRVGALPVVSRGWVFVVPGGFLWFPVASRGLVWVPVVSCGFPWVPDVSRQIPNGLVRDFADIFVNSAFRSGALLCGLLPSGSERFPWFPVVSRGWVGVCFPCCPMSSLSFPRVSKTFQAFTIIYNN